jgi:hypothetical protein
MTGTPYENRQDLEFFSWPELTTIFTSLAELVMVAPNNLSRQLRSELFTMASVAGGCQHCQAGGRLRVIASIEEQVVIDRILGHLGHATEPLDLAHPGRGPPTGELPF